MNVVNYIIFIILAERLSVDTNIIGNVGMEILIKSSLNIIMFSKRLTFILAAILKWIHALF